MTALLPFERMARRYKVTLTGSAELYRRWDTVLSDTRASMGMEISTRTSRESTIIIMGASMERGDMEVHPGGSARKRLKRSSSPSRVTILSERKSNPHVPLPIVYRQGPMTDGESGISRNIQPMLTRPDPDSTSSLPFKSNHNGNDPSVSLPLGQMRMSSNPARPNHKTAFTGV